MSRAGSNFPSTETFYGKALHPQYISASPVFGINHKTSTNPAEDHSEAQKSGKSSPCSACRNLSGFNDISIAGVMSTGSGCTGDISGTKATRSQRQYSTERPPGNAWGNSMICTNYKSPILESTTNLMKYRLNYPSLLSRARKLIRTKDVNACRQSLGAFAEEILRKRADRGPPKSTGKPADIDNALWHINHQWKCRYYALLDAIDLLYKDYQLLHHVSGNSNHSLTTAVPDRLLSGYCDNLLFGGDKSLHVGVLAGADPVTYLASRISEHVSCNETDRKKQSLWPHRFTASVAFILDVIAQCRLARVELDRRAAFHERILNVTQQAKQQRERLKKHIAEQREVLSKLSECVLVMRQKTEVLEKATQEPRLLLRVSSPMASAPKRKTKGAALSLKHTSDRNEGIRLKVVTKQAELETLERVLREEEHKRRQMHNRLQEITGNIRVYCRVRPKSPKCRFMSYLKVASDDKLLFCPEAIPERFLGRSGAASIKSIKAQQTCDDPKCFIFDKVFGPDAKQLAVYKEVDDLIISCVDGFNVCIMAYGQTGSGKTHTMFGTPQDPGVNRRAIRRLLRLCKEKKHWNYQLSMSMLEVYQEDVFDLLANGCGDGQDGSDSMSHGSRSSLSDLHSPINRQLSPTGFMTSFAANSFAQPRPPLQRRLSMVKLLSTREDELVLQNLTERSIKNEEDVMHCLELGERRRSTGVTRLNTTSSRSHMILLLRVTGEHVVHKTHSRGTLILADLAGSENVTKSGSVGRRFQEAACINKSLSCLARVFDSLRRRLKPAYRETKLTYLLKPTLGGDAKCLVFINVRCEPENLSETLRAVNFGQGALQVAPWKACSLTTTTAAASSTKLKQKPSLGK